MAALATGSLLLVVFVASTALPFVLSARGDLPEWISVNGVFLALRWDDDPAAAFDRVARPAWLWRALWNGGVVLAVSLAAVGLLAVFAVALVTVLEPAVGNLTPPRSVLLAPGIDGFLPLAVAPALFVALVVALFAHESGHALASRTDGIDVSAVGAVLLGALPIGAYVEHDAEKLDGASALARARMLAGGVTGNFVVAALAVVLVAGPVAGSIAVASGVPVGAVAPGGPAAAAGIDPGDVLVQVDGLQVEDRADLDRALADRDRVVTAQFANGDVEYVERSLYVVQVSPGAPEGIDPNARITAVDGTPVDTVAGFRAAARDAPTATLATTNGTYTVPIGVSVSEVARSGALATAGAPIDDPTTILSVDGHRTLVPADLATVLQRHEVGDTVPVRAYVDGSVRTYDVELRAGVDREPRLGVFYRQGTSGLVLSDFGVQAYPASNYLHAFGLSGGFGANSLADRLAGFVLLPLAGEVGLAPYDFPGFTGHVTNFYVVTGPLAALGGGAFALATALFWFAWVNLNIGLFNCIPALPLDGGRLVHATADAVRGRWFPEKETLPGTVTLAATAAVVLSLAVTLLFPLLA